MRVIEERQCRGATAKVIKVVMIYAKPDVSNAVVGDDFIGCIASGWS